MKNETEEEIGDEELIAILRDSFDNGCEGSLELLKGRELDAFARKLRREKQAAALEGGETGWGMK